MKSFTRTTRRAVLISCVAGAAVVGAVGFGAAAYADGTPTPGTSQSAAATDGPAAGPAAGPEQGKHEPHIGGTVLTVSGSTVTVQDRDGFTRTIRLADGVEVTKDDASSSVSAITKGVHVEASGTVASDGTTLNATAVHLGEPTPPKGGRPGPGRGDAPTPPEGAPTPPEGAPTPSEGARTVPEGSKTAPTDAPTPPSGAATTPSGASTTAPTPATAS